jgi:hypothetical protein
VSSSTIRRIWIPRAPPARDACDRNLREFERRPQVYLKISQVLRRVDGRIPEDAAFHRPPGRALWGFRRGPRALRQR